MSFLKRLKDQISDPRWGNHSHKDRVLVNNRDLRELIEHFERLDSYDRAIGDMQCHINRQLHNTLLSVWDLHDKNSDLVWMMIMDTLNPLMLEKQRDQAIIQLNVRKLSPEPRPIQKIRYPSWDVPHGTE
ncbi:MAG: hypothetical protein OEX12_14445 [Gammaproteobacteria bacterium]|nr:hypothetical protein [Gammaproteobacteria bacterium]